MHVRRRRVGRFVGVLRTGVLEQEPDAFQRSGAQLLVGCLRVLDRTDGGDQGPHVDRVAGDQVEEAAEVPALGPPDVSRGVVDALELVAVVVPARPVGPREPDVELLLVVVVPRQVEPGLADVDDRGPVPGQPRSELDRPVGAAPRRDQHVVGTEAAGGAAADLLDVGGAVRVGPGARQRTGLLRHPAACLHGVDADHPHAGGDEQPDHQLPDQPEPDDAGQLTELGLRPTDALHGDRPHRRERGVLRVDTVGHLDDQVGRHPVHLGVQRELVAGRGDQVADLELLGAGADLDDDAAQRVTQRRVAVETVHRLLVRRQRTLLGHRVDELLHLVRTRLRLAEQREPGLADLHHLGAGGDQGVERAHQHAPGPAGRDRDVEHHELAGAIVLRNLLHAAATPAPRALRYQSSRLSSCQICFELSRRPERWSAISRDSGSGCRKPVPTSSPGTSRSSMSVPRSLVTQARSGTPKDALGLSMISSGTQARAACLEGGLLHPAVDLVLAGQGERRLEHHRVDERHPDLRGGGHAGPVGVGEVEALAGTSASPRGTSG